MFGIMSHRHCQSDLFRDSPFYARALELEAKHCDLEAKRNDLPSLDFDGPVLMDPAKEQRKKIEDGMRKIRADFHRLSADMKRWKAKKYRKADTTQKSLNPFDKALALLKAQPLELGNPVAELEAASNDLDRALKNPQGTGVDVDTGMMPQRDVDVAAPQSPAPTAVNPDQPFDRTKKGYATRRR